MAPPHLPVRLAAVAAALVLVPSAVAAPAVSGVGARLAVPTAREAASGIAAAPARAAGVAAAPDRTPVSAGAAAPALARAPGTGATARLDYDWPTGSRAAVLRGFDPPALEWLAGHRGVDLAAPAGSEVLAAADGVVAFAGVVAGRPVVSVDHADGIRTTYEPVEASVRAGQRVSRGDVLGTLVAGHRADAADALHWGARTGRRAYVNPLRLLAPAVIRLKPLGGA